MSRSGFKLHLFEFMTLCFFISGPSNQCPPSHKWAYLEGGYCCKFDMEHVDVSDGSQCDGSKISLASSCCKDHAWLKCPYTEGCVNYVEVAGN